MSGSFIIILIVCVVFSGKMNDLTQQALGDDTNRDHLYIYTYIRPVLNCKNTNLAFNLCRCLNIFYIYQIERK